MTEPAIPNDVPAFACDAHAHVMGPVSRYPLAEERDWTPPDRPVEAYESVLNALGITRGVIVHSSSHGTDNRVTLDAIRHMNGRCVGIALVQPQVSDEELEALHSGGMRGIRISTMLKGSVGVADMESLAKRFAALGWQIQLHFDKAEEIIALLPIIRSLPVPVVFDHMARARGGAGTKQPAFQALLELLRNTDHCWVKICSWYRLSDAGPPYEDMRRLVDALVETRRDRLLWGSNWPHPLLKGPPPDDEDLLRQFMQWVGQARQDILVDNPARLFGFDTPARSR